VSDVFARNRPSPQCLSAWTVSRAAAGILEGTTRRAVDQHLEVCPRCAAAVRSEGNEVEAAGWEPVPRALLALPEQRRGRRSWLALVGLVPVAAAAAAYLIVVVAPSKQPATRIKGADALSVSVSVMRNQIMVVDDVAVDSAGSLRPGDGVRFRVRLGPWASSTAADRPAVALAGLASHGWTTYFTGPLPPEGWIPVGVVITPEGETKVRIRVCRNDGTALLADESAFGRGRSAGLCREQTLDLMAGR
jgi:hypothetical protein